MNLMLLGMFNFFFFFFFFLFPLSKFPPSLYAPEILEVHQDEISQVFLVALDPLITQLLPCSPFMEQVLNENLGGLKAQLPVLSEGSALTFWLYGP